MYGVKTASRKATAGGGIEVFRYNMYADDFSRIRGKVVIWQTFAFIVGREIDNDSITVTPLLNPYDSGERIGEVSLHGETVIVMSVKRAKELLAPFLQAVKEA